MSRRTKISFNGSAGLFDDLDFEQSLTSLPVHPDIARHAEKVRLSGGIATDKDGVGDDELSQPVALDVDADSIRFMSLGSGSSGNCAYIGDSDGGFLVDAGIDPVKVEEALKANGLSFAKIHGIILTHDHRDHTQYAYTIVRKNRHIPIFCTNKAMNGLLRRHSISRRIKDYHRAIFKEIPFNIGRFEITAFEVMHDGTDNVGFFIRHGERTFAVATDLGSISERADYYLRQADFMVLEANYDSEMLIHGSYPEYLKARIIASNGHLDNAVTARFLAEAWSKRLRYVFLCHLSHENNTPEKAISAVKGALESVGITVGGGCDTPTDREADVQLVALPRHDPSIFYTLR